MHRTKHWANNFAGLFLVFVVMFVVVFVAQRQWGSGATTALLWLLGLAGLACLGAWTWLSMQADTAAQLSNRLFGRG